MRNLVLILLGLILAAGIGYFMGYDHGFDSKGIPPIPVPTPSLAADTMSAIIGNWQSTEDPKFTREILNDGSVIDRYEGSEPDAKGRWMVFTKEIPDTAFTGLLEEGVVYLSLSMSESEKLYFRILKVDADTLEISYLDRGNTLSFRRVPQGM